MQITRNERIDMFRHATRTVVIATVVAVVAVASLVLAGGASAAWQTYNAHGVRGPFDQPHLACTYGNTKQITVSDPDVGGRYGPVYRNADGSYTTGWGTGGSQEWVYYQATLYRMNANGGWDLTGQGPWWKTFTGPWKPNVFTTSNWFNVNLGLWDYQIEVADGAGYYHRLSGGPTTFSNLAAGSRYAVSIEYYWDHTSYYDAAWAYSWEPNAC
jgi:hypothetical protein